MSENSLPSQRQLRYGEIIRSIISEYLLRGDLYDPNIDLTSVTLSYVKMSKDLKIASAYFMPLGGENKKKFLDLLNKNKYLFQRYLSSARLKSKFVPKINFYIDNSFDEAERIERLLLDEKVKRDLNNDWT